VEQADNDIVELTLIGLIHNSPQSIIYSMKKKGGGGEEEE